MLRVLPKLANASRSSSWTFLIQSAAARRPQAITTQARGGGEIGDPWR